MHDHVTPDPGVRSGLTGSPGQIGGSPGLTAAQVEAAVRAIRDQVVARPAPPRVAEGRHPLAGPTGGGARHREWTVLGPDGSEMTMVQQICLGPIPERPAVPSPAAMAAAELDGWWSRSAAAAVEGDSAGDAA